MTSLEGLELWGWLGERSRERPDQSNNTNQENMHLDSRLSVCVIWDPALLRCLGFRGTWGCSGSEGSAGLWSYHLAAVW